MKFIDVTGYFYSGSSAVVDLIREYDDIYECKAEIRFIKDPGGLFELEYALVHNWDLINSTAAVTTYLDMCKIWARGNGRNPFSVSGLGYARKLNPDFYKLSQEFIDNITTYKYKGDYYHYKFRKGYFKYILDRWRWAAEYLSKGKVKTANRNIEDCYFTHPTEEEYNKAVKVYIEKIFNMNGIAENMSILLDQAISANHPEVLSKYFNDAKMIIVTRDPRDIYIDMSQWGMNLDDDIYSRESGLRFSIRHKQLLNNTYDSNKDILYIKFEELCLNYEKQVKKIETFLGINSSNHTLVKKYFDPEKSKHNVGIWKTNYDKYKQAIDVIKETMPEYCVL